MCHFSSRKHLEMEGIINVMKAAGEYCIEQDETAMNESVSLPDTREPESDASPMADEEGHAIYAASDIKAMSHTSRDSILKYI